MVIAGVGIGLTDRPQPNRKKPPEEDKPQYRDFAP
jgi:hypothetical protein